jgi:hypothetical protein
MRFPLGWIFLFKNIRVITLGMNFRVLKPEKSKKLEESEKFKK